MSAARSTLSRGDRLSELAERLDPQTRYLDLCLIFRRKTTGEILLKVGGRWDRLTETYTDDEPTACHIVDVKENQVPVVKKFAEWLAKYLAGEKRERVLMTGGERRGGKSFITTACMIALALVVPGAICFLVSPTLSKRDELERYVKRQTLKSWRSYRGMPEYRFTLANGSTLQSITGDTADALKRGKANAILYNEPQDMSVDVATYGLPALIDDGGLALFAGNPPRKKKGAWYGELRRLILEGEYKAGAFFEVPSKGNDAIDQDARSDIAELLHDLDPTAAAADADGLWLPVGDYAYAQYFERKRNVGPLPQVGDVTGEVTKRKVFRAFTQFGGADFQGRPWNAGVIVRAFGDAKRPVYYPIATVLKEGFEDEFLDEVFFLDYQPEALIWIGDASGTWQDAHHSRGRVSFDIFKARRWRIEPPQKKKSDRGEHPRNPDVADRVNLINRLLVEGRLILDESKVPALVEALRECEAKDGKPRGRHAHLTDALGYALWWAEPMPKPPGQRVQPGTSHVVARPKGPRLF